MFASVNFKNLKVRTKFRPSIFVAYNGIVTAQMKVPKKTFLLTRSSHKIFAGIRIFSQV